MIRVIDERASAPQVTGSEALAVGRLADDLARAAQSADGPVKLQFGFGIQDLPAVVVAPIAELLRDMSEGRDVTVAPADLLIGSESVASVLGVSRPWVNRLIDRGDLPGERCGSKRRVRLGDVVAYRRADDDRRRAKLDWAFVGDE